VVTLTQTGAPSGATFTVAGTNPAVGTFSFSPTAQQGGDVYAVTFTGTDNSPSGCDRTLTVYLRVSSLPVITATPNSLTLCEGQAVRYRVRASDADPTAVTLSGPTVVSSPGAPALALTHTPSLPASGNSVETEAVGVTPVVTADATYTLTYTATDSDGCVTTTTVTVTVLNTPPSSVELTRVGDGDPFGEEICYTAVVFDNGPADEGGPRRVPGVPVLFTVTGTTGNSGVFTVVTNANGEAVHCLTPRFPGTITVTAGIDLNGDGVVDAGTTPDTDNVTVPAPVQVGPGCFISGRGKVNVSDPLFGNLPVLGSFTVDVSPKRNGTFKGSISLTVPNAGTTGGRRTNIVIRSTRLESMSCSEDATGRRAVLFGRATVKGMSTQGLSGTVPFRVDVLDAGTPGVPNDQFVLTLLNTATDSPVGPLGGNLAAERGRRNPKDDIKVRLGASIP
ncbi:MAG: Bacterial Ig-like domain (group 1), partial [Armatimonadetes bacterium]|nr:Bacterial Ig-like domain (group 1) [Armatimonadota bacterium]